MRASEDRPTMTSSYTGRRIVSYYARPASYNTGGVNTSRQQWMRAFADLGIDVLMVNPRGGYEEQLVDHEGVGFQSIRHIGRRRSTMLAPRLRRLLRPGDVVYLHEGWTFSNIWAAATCRLSSVPYVVMPHGVYAPRIVRTLRRERLRRPAEKFVLRGARAVHTFFGTENSEIAQLEPEAKTFAATTGFEMPESEWRPHETAPYLSWVGRYDILHKGIDLILSALQSIPEESRPMLWMVGPDYNGDRNRVSALVVELGLQQWVTVGNELPTAQVQTHMAQSRAFVHFPRWEAFGRTIVEALAMGVPVAVSSGAHIAQDLEGVTIVVPNESVTGIASALEAAWQGAIAGEAGRDWVKQNLSWPDSARNALHGLKQSGISFDTERFVCD